MNIESNYLEFKGEYTPDVRYSIAAFANSQGGVLKIGIDDNGKIRGIVNVDETLTKITNSVRDSILPDITMFINYNVTEKSVIEVTVSEGTNKPYFLKEKGMKPSGIYVRQGASSAPASWEQIRTMLKQTDGDKYESLRSLEQSLSFSFAKEEFTSKGIPFDETKYIALGIMNLDRTFSNLGQLISDDCQHSIKVAVFDGVEKKVFKDRKEFRGSVLKQLHDVFDYLILVNKTHTTFTGLERVDKSDYSELVVREALVNAIVHRDYSFSGSIIINIYDDKIEFISLGGLVGGLSEGDIRSGISQTRNEKLASIFFRLKHIETYGYGLPNIFNDFAELTIKPEIKITDNSFVIVIPNKNYSQVTQSDKTNIAAKTQISSSENHRIIMDYLKANGFLTRIDIEKILGIKQSRSYQIVREMKSLGLIEASRNNKNTYVLAG